MLTVISGNDSVGILNFLKSKKKAYEGQEVIEINSKKYTSIDIEDLSKSVGMFSTKKLIIIKPESVSDIGFDERFLLFISENPDVEILVDASKIIKTTKIYKLLVKFGKKFVFDKKRDYDVYNISDALLIQNNKNYAIDLLLNFCKSDDDFYNVLSNIHFGLRNLVASVEKNAAWNSMHPFVRKKFSNVKVDISKVKISYKKIFDLDAKSKSSSEKRLNLLVDFMLESNL